MAVQYTLPATDPVIPFCADSQHLIYSHCSCVSSVIGAMPCRAMLELGAMLDLELYPPSGPLPLRHYHHQYDSTLSYDSHTRPAAVCGPSGGHI